jgi:hypothetical protein
MILGFYKYQGINWLQNRNGINMPDNKMYKGHYTSINASHSGASGTFSLSNLVDSLLGIWYAGCYATPGPIRRARDFASRDHPGDRTKENFSRYDR